MSAETTTDEAVGFVFRVTYSEEGGNHVEAGETLSHLDTETQLYVIGRMLINLGTRLLTSRAGEDDGDAEWEDE